MPNLLNNAFFWQKIDTIFSSNKLIITKKKGEYHSIYKNLRYPVDYGNLDDTLPENSGISVYKGSVSASVVDCIIVAADILKKDIEVKLLCGCTADEELSILQFLNQTEFQKGILIRRGDDIPAWAITE
ncbi:MAG: Inorganic pyrophosphatase [Erysipelotrichaceae bacterium]|nr:Inorganic pyrophosphatase [Erysipelotrichaceae bacterium]MDD3924057.1 Inorganic pyrophosphatase [Erysipelotrichaceae bacterium]MDD4642341.1 Inorganic pyrophosphatase [Erysipelotrichaceae bacterium]